MDTVENIVAAVSKGFLTFELGVNLLVNEGFSEEDAKDMLEKPEEKK